MSCQTKITKRFIEIKIVILRADGGFFDANEVAHGGPDRRTDQRPHKDEEAQQPHGGSTWSSGHQRHQGPCIPRRNEEQGRDQGGLGRVRNFIGVQGCACQATPAVGRC